MIFFTFDIPEEKDKFMALYEAYKKTIYFTIGKFISDKYAIEDISQEIYLIIANNLDSINLEDPQRSQNYIITITRNYCKNYLRSLGRRNECSLEYIKTLNRETDETFNLVYTREKVRLLAKEINKLNDIYKSVMELKYINQFDNEEIADFLKIKKKTVEMRLYRANTILRERLINLKNEK